MTGVIVDVFPACYLAELQWFVCTFIVKF